MALIGFLVYNFLIKKNPGKEGQQGQFPQGQEGEINPPGQKEENAPGPEIKTKGLSAEKVLAPTLSADKTKVIYYSQINGNVWQSSFNGSNLTKISETILNNLAKIIWLPDKTKVVSVYQSPDEHISKYIYDYKTGKARLLDSHVQEINWSSRGDKIVYQYTNELNDENNINISNPDGTGLQNVFKTRMTNLNLDWTAAGISFYEKPSGLAQGTFFLLNPLTKGLTKVISNIYGLSVKWSPQGDKILFSKTTNQGKNIGLSSILKNGSKETALDIQTPVEKCTWSQDNRTIFCAIPKNINEAETMPDDFYKGTFISDDGFWKINLDTAEKTPLLEPQEIEGTYDAVDLFLSPLEDYLFFVNKKDGLLYSIEL